MKFRASVLACLSVLIAPGVILAEDVDLKTAFHRVAAFKGAAYLVGRDHLVSRGKESLAFLKTQVNSPDWRKRDLARALVIQLQRPDDAEQWRAAFGDFKQSFRLMGKGVVVSFPHDSKPVMDGRVAKNGRLILGKDCLPFLNEYQQQLECWAASRLHPKGIERKNGYRLLALFADGSSADSLVSYLHAHAAPELKSTILALGTKSRQALWRCVRTVPGDAEFGSLTTQFERTAFYKHLQAAAQATALLVKVADPTTEGKLRSRLNDGLSGQLVLAIVQGLSALRSEAAMPDAFRQLERIALLSSPPKSTFAADYRQLRSAFLGFGEKAVAYLTKVSGEDSAVRSALARGLLFELRSAKKVNAFYQQVGKQQIQMQMLRGRGSRLIGRQANDDELSDEELERNGRKRFWQRTFEPNPRASLAVPTPLRLERAAALGMSQDLVWLAGRSGQLNYRLAAKGLTLLRRRDPQGPSIVVASAVGGHAQALQVYQTLLDARRAPHYAQAIVEACLILEDAKAIPLMQRIKELGQQPRPRIAKGTLEMAKVVESYLQGQLTMVSMLKHQQAAVRRIAAKKLGRKGDRRSLPVLLRAALESTGQRHLDFRSALLSVGAPAKPFLEARIRASEDWRERLICEVLLLESGSPLLLRKCGEANGIRTHGFRSRRGPSMEDYRQSGYRVADYVTAKAIPWLESTIVFDTSELNFGIAAFALARFQRDRSLRAVVSSMRQAGFIRGGHIGAEALREFGEAGVSAAKSVPAENTALPRFRARATRRRGATQVLALSKDQKSVENVLRAFQSLYTPRQKPPAETYDHWQTRMRQYLRIAAGMKDSRLVAPLLKFATHSDEYLAHEALVALRPHNRDDVAAAAARAIRAFSGNYIRPPALLILIKRYGGNVEEFLVKQQANAGSLAERTRVIQAIQTLVEGPSLWQKSGLSAPAAGERVQTARLRFLKCLKGELQATQPMRSGAAAEALARYDASNKEVMQLIAKWAGDQTKLSYRIIQRLVATGEAFAGQALLSAYRKGGRSDASLARGLGRLGYQPAVEDITVAVDRGLAGRSRGLLTYEVSALGAMGDPGLKVVARVITQSKRLKDRVHAARTLAIGRPANAFAAIHSLLSELVESSVDHPQLVGALETRTRLVSQFTHTLADSLIQIDAERAYPILAEGAVRLKTGELADRLAYRALLGKPKVR